MGRMDNSHSFLVEDCIVVFGRQSGPHDHTLGKYIRTHIFYLLETVVFSNKSTNSINPKFLPFTRDFHCIFNYSWGQLVWHIYISRCAVHHHTTVKRWIVILFCSLFGHGSVCCG
ncbi:hypothetical protein AHAS_Ahas08G0041300 [Arachis hypogaea]